MTLQLRRLQQQTETSLMRAYLAVVGLQRGGLP